MQTCAQYKFVHEKILKKKSTHIELKKIDYVKLRTFLVLFLFLQIYSKKEQTSLSVSAMVTKSVAIRGSQLREDFRAAKVSPYVPVFIISKFKLLTEQLFNTQNSLSLKNRLFPLLPLRVLTVCWTYKIFTEIIKLRQN